MLTVTQEMLSTLKQITPTEFNVATINSIQDDNPDDRQNSKPITFALTYLGTQYTIQNKCGFSPTESKAIVDNYNDLYSVSLDWVNDKLQECCKLGYATVAFGLRVRTPLLAKSILNTSATHPASAAEARSVGNAISGQSYGMLTNRAAIEFMNKVHASKYKYDILPVSLIHDAIYIMVKDDVEVLAWANRELIKSMAWQDLPELEHDVIKMSSQLDVFHPHWGSPIKIPKEIKANEIKDYIKSQIK